MKIKKYMILWGMMGCLAFGLAGCGSTQGSDPTTVAAATTEQESTVKETEIAKETEAVATEAVKETEATVSESLSKTEKAQEETRPRALETNEAILETLPEGTPTFMDMVVSEAILEENKDHYMGGECQGEGHIILEEVEENGISTVYALMMYGGYEFQNVDYFIKTSGTGVIPVVMKFDLRLSSSTPMISMEWPMDGSGYNNSIKRMFPEHLWDRTLSIQDEDREILEAMERGYAERYLEEMGRDAVIGDYADVQNRTLLTDHGISVEVSNKMSVNEKLMGPYPGWHGTRENVENGVRYIYSKFYEEETNQIIYEKCVFDTMETVEKFVYNAKTGDPVEAE